MEKENGVFKKLVQEINTNDIDPTNWDISELERFLRNDKVLGLKKSLGINGKDFLHSTSWNSIQNLTSEEKTKLALIQEKLIAYIKEYIENTSNLNKKKKKKKGSDSDSD